MNTKNIPPNVLTDLTNYFKSSDQTPDKTLVLCLRTCNSDRRSINDFTWPEYGPLEAPDWSPEPVCGYGLHGWLWGEGDGSLGDWNPDAVWIVFAAASEEIVDLEGKVKVPRAFVLFVGTRFDATNWLASRSPGKAIIGATITAGEGGTATVGYKGKATAGDHGKATAGYRGTATAGYKGTATAGYRGTATAGYEGKATAGDYGTATAGYQGTATAGYEGTETAGDNGTAPADNRRTATARDYGTATAGE
jgi:hypothetical protein